MLFVKCTAWKVWRCMLTVSLQKDSTTLWLSCRLFALQLVSHFTCPWKLEAGIKSDSRRAETQSRAKLGELGHLHAPPLYPTSTGVSLSDLEEISPENGEGGNKACPREVQLPSHAAQCGVQISARRHPWMWLSGRRQSSPAPRLKDQCETKSTRAHSNVTSHCSCWTVAQKIDEYPACGALFSFWPGKIPAWYYWGGGLDDLCCSQQAVGDHLIPLFKSILSGPVSPPVTSMLQTVCVNVVAMQMGPMGEKATMDIHETNWTCSNSLIVKCRGSEWTPPPLTVVYLHIRTHALFSNGFSVSSLYLIESAGDIPSRGCLSLRSRSNQS